MVSKRESIARTRFSSVMREHGYRIDFGENERVIVENRSPFSGTSVERFGSLGTAIERFRPITLDDRLSLEYLFR